MRVQFVEIGLQIEFMSVEAFLRLGCRVYRVYVLGPRVTTEIMWEQGAILRLCRNCKWVTRTSYHEP